MFKQFCPSLEPTIDIKKNNHLPTVSLKIIKIIFFIIIIILGNYIENYFPRKLFLKTHIKYFPTLILVDFFLYFVKNVYTTYSTRNKTQTL